MLSDLLQTTIIRYFPNLRKSPNGWLRQDCPLCIHRGHRPDTKGRFGLNFLKINEIGISCFNCQYKSKFVSGTMFSKDFIWFLEIIGLPKEDIKKLKFQAFREKEAGAIFAAPKLTGITTHNWKTVELPKDA